MKEGLKGYYTIFDVGSYEILVNSKCLRRNSCITIMIILIIIML